ncbi:hypothetical protein [Leptolyngbya sp. FACHB-17]|uniref:hypothetical protein n=1 Tax=unclassified Leptolyngbya TaxID=2650499 RepID=UPI00168147C1|nr:hypothetical protein [Leptolyngbya sp. FACHB-17]MBD2079577.1 hypothetical protein [Leptolyngbya sp. FACHB-17]
MKGKIKTVLAVLALPAIWALGAKTGKGKLFRCLLALSLYYSPVAIVKSVVAPDHSIEQASVTSQSENKGQAFIDAFQSQINVRKRGGHSTEYAEEVIGAWTNRFVDRDRSINAAYQNACSELAEYGGDAQKIGELAYRVNGFQRSLDQYVVYNQIKFDAANSVGCPLTPQDHP